MIFQRRQKALLWSKGLIKKLSMIRENHNHKLQTNPQHCEEELQDIYSNKTTKKQWKQSNQLCLLRQDDYKTRKDIK